MVKGGYPSVNLMDSHTCPPVPPRLNQGQRCAWVGQKLLFILASLALCGMIVEACFIYRLYQTESVTSASSSKIIAEQDVTSTKWPGPGPVISPSKPVTSVSSSKIIAKMLQDVTSSKFHGPVISPSKPVAHLTDGEDVKHAKDIMAWSTDADPLLYKMTYKDRSLVIKKEGYYYVYSKVSFSDNGVFHHHVDLRTEKFTGKSINLLQSRKYSIPSKNPSHNQSSSYLGGVFHLFKGDAIFVKVSDTSKIVRQNPTENFFGAYMI